MSVIYEKVNSLIDIELIKNTEDKFKKNAEELNDCVEKMDRLLNLYIGFFDWAEEEDVFGNIINRLNYISEELELNTIPSAVVNLINTKEEMFADGYSKLKIKTVPEKSVAK